MLKTIRHGIGLGLLLCGVVMLTWASIPMRQQKVERAILPTEMRLPLDEQPEQAVQERRQVKLEWPGSMRIGDSEEIRLTFEPKGAEAIDSSPGTKLSNIYDHYNLMAEGRFEVAGLEVEPANPVRESLPPGQSIVYIWKITAEKTGLYPGTVWLSLRFLPLDGSEAIQVPIFVTSINLKLTSLFGISGPIARLLGGLAIVLGMITSIDVMIDWIRNKISHQTRRDSK